MPNPVVKNLENVAAKTGGSALPMTLQGTINKSIILFLLVILSGTYTWKLTMVGNAMAMSLLWVGVIGGFITALIGIFSPKIIHIIAPIYALFEGLFLGAISAVFNAVYNGIVLQAILLTFAVFTVMLLLYKFRILKATPGFVKGIIYATGGIALYYLVAIGAQAFFHKDLSVFAMGTAGIFVQIIIVGIAALNLVLDFNYIETGISQGLPKKMEWYGAFGLLITIVWLYIEILRLLAIANRR